MDEQGDQRALADALDRFSRKADEILKSGNTNTARIEVNAGGVGIWVAVTACFGMLALNVALLFNLAAHDRQIERMQDHLNAIYMMAPHLKPKDSE
jgi:hypothetical protein